MKTLPANPGLKAILSKRDLAALLKKPMKDMENRRRNRVQDFQLATAAQLQSFQDFALDFLQTTRAGWTRTDKGGQGDCGYRALCCGRV